MPEQTGHSHTPNLKNDAGRATPYRILLIFSGLFLLIGNQVSMAQALDRPNSVFFSTFCRTFNCRFEHSEIKVFSYDGIRSTTPFGTLFKTWKYALSNEMTLEVDRVIDGTLLSLFPKYAIVSLRLHLKQDQLVNTQLVNTETTRIFEQFFVFATGKSYGFSTQKCISGVQAQEISGTGFSVACEKYGQEYILEIIT